MQEQVGGQGAEERGRSNAAITKTTNTPSFLHLHYLDDDDYDGHDVDDEHHQNHQNPLLFAPAWWWWLWWWSCGWWWLRWWWWASPKAPTPWCWLCHLKISPFHNLTFAEKRKVLKSGNKCFSSYLRDRRFLRIHGEGWMREEWFQSWTFYYKYEGSKLKDLVLMSQIRVWVVFTMISQI